MFCVTTTCLKPIQVLSKELAPGVKSVPVDCRPQELLALVMNMQTNFMTPPSCLPLVQPREKQAQYDRI